MNTDVQKSLGYLKKSLKMTRRAIANAVSQDAQALVELNVIATGINNLINEIENVDPAVPVVPAVVGGAAIGNTLAPNPVIPVAVPVAAVSSDNGIDFLVP
jgi:ribosomal protein S7